MWQHAHTKFYALKISFKTIIYGIIFLKKIHVLQALFVIRKRSRTMHNKPENLVGGGGI